MNLYPPFLGTLMILESFYNTSSEAISHQDDVAFTTRLEAAISSIVNLITESSIKTGELARSEEIKSLQSLIKERFGFNVKIITYNHLLAVKPPILTKAKNVNYDPKLWIKDAKSREAAKLLDNDLLAGKLSVDNDKAVITIPKEFVTTLYANFHILVKTYKITSSKIIAAGIMHEIGHVFSYFDKIDNITNHNNTLSDFVKTAISGNGSRKQLLKYIDTLDNKDDADSIMSAYKGNSKLVLASSIARATAKYYASRSPYGEYAEEDNADLFASRFGYGEYLSTLLRTISSDTATKRLIFDTLNIFYKIYLILSLINTVFLLVFLILTGGLVSLPTILILTVFIAIRLYLTDMILFGKDGSPVHDDVPNRIAKIRLDLINRLSSLDMNPKQKKKVLADIDAIDKYYKELPSDDLADKLIGKLFTSIRSKQNAIKLENTLMSLTNNNLTLAAAKLEISLALDS